jgi:hypothetical protein
VSVLLGTGDGRFSTSIDYPGGSAPESAVLTDLNGDGKLDVLMANPSARAVSALINSCQ